MRYFLILVFLYSFHIVKGQTLDTIIINSKDKAYFKKKDLFKPEIDGLKVNIPLKQYFKKSCESAYYIVNFNLGDFIYRSCEGLVINGKFEGLWIEKDNSGEIRSSHQFKSNKFEGAQLYFNGKKMLYEISCSKNEIIEFKKYDSKGELYMVRTYSNGNLLNQEIFGLNPEFYILKEH